MTWHYFVSLKIDDHCGPSAAFESSFLTARLAKNNSLARLSVSYRKDESKEPIVEVRTEDECSANHNAAGPIEPNETTPLTEPE